jgi:hypothetical protein
MQVKKKRQNVPEDPSTLVYQGREEHLFLIGGHHSVKDYFTGVQEPAEASVAALFANSDARTGYCADNRIYFRSIVFPEKLVALSNLVEFPVRSLYRDVYVAQGGEHHRGLPLYPVEGLAKPKHWKRTDTHLSASGCNVVMEQLLADWLPDHWASFRLYNRDNFTIDRFSGDLGRKFAPPIKEKVRSYTPHESLAVEGNGVRGSNDGTMFIAENPKSATDRTLLIFGDSFFRMMLAELSFFFRRIVFCRSRFFHYELVESVSPNAIFFGTAERYLTDCVDDRERPNFFLIPALKGKLTRPTPGFPQALARCFDREKLL